MAVRRKEKKARERVVTIRGDQALEYEMLYGEGVARLSDVRRLAPRLDLRGLMEGADKSMDVCDFNRRAEQAFLIILDAMLDKHGDVPVRDVVAECAYRLNISVETAKRYLQKYTAPSAPYVVESSVVRRRVTQSDTGQEKQPT